MKNDAQNESSEEENKDEPDENKSVTKNQKGKGLPVRRIKKGSRKGSQVHREAEKMIKEITSIKNNLDKNLSASELKDDESDKKVNVHNKTPEKADGDKSTIPALNEAPKKDKSQKSPALIGMQRKSLLSDFTEVSEDKDEDFEELEQTPKKTPLQIKEEWLKKFEDADKAKIKFNQIMSYALELETEIEKLSENKDFKNMKAD